jgi:hypothetical protein
VGGASSKKSSLRALLHDSRQPLGHGVVALTVKPRLAAGEHRVTAVGEVYDLIWRLELPPFRNDEPLDELVVRGVLMALASYLNHQQLKARKCHVYPSDELLASQIGRSTRTVARVLDYLLRAELLVLVRAELRPGRGRVGRPPIYSLPIDVWQHWPQRVIRRSPNGLDTGVQTMTAQTPVVDGSDTGVQKRDGSDTGVQKEAMVRTPVSTEPGQPVNPAREMNPAREPGHARARADGLSGSGYEVALPLMAATSTSATPATVGRWPCPDCGQQVLEDGRGHRAGPEPCRAFGRGGRVERCQHCKEWVDHRNPLLHARACPTRRELMGEVVQAQEAVPDGAIQGQHDSKVVDEQLRARVDEPAGSAEVPRRRKEKVSA